MPRLVLVHAVLSTVARLWRSLRMRFPLRPMRHAGKLFVE